MDLSTQLADLAEQYRANPSPNLADEIVSTFRKRMRTLGATGEHMAHTEEPAMRQEIVGTVLRAYPR